MIFCCGKIQSGCIGSSALWASTHPSLIITTNIKMEHAHVDNMSLENKKDLDRKKKNRKDCEKEKQEILREKEKQERLRKRKSGKFKKKQQEILREKQKDWEKEKQERLSVLGFPGQVYPQLLVTS